MPIYPVWNPALVFDMETSAFTRTVQKNTLVVGIVEPPGGWGGYSIEEMYSISYMAVVA